MPNNPISSSTSLPEGTAPSAQVTFHNVDNATPVEAIQLTSSQTDGANEQNGGIDLEAQCSPKGASACAADGRSPLEAVDSRKNPSKAISVSQYNTPKNTLMVVVKAGVAKGMLLWWQILVLGWQAGVFIGLGAALTIAIEGSLDGATTTGSMPVVEGGDVTDVSGIDVSSTYPLGMKKLLGASVFPLGLILIVLSGGHLFTGDVMYMWGALIGGKVKWHQLLKDWFWTYFGNLAGSLTLAYFMFSLTNLFVSPISGWLSTTAVAKVGAGWGANFLKGIGCNYLVALALWCACTAEDTISKIVAIWWPVMAFVGIGFEHSVANMFIIPVAIMVGAPVSTSDYISFNLIPVTLGNIVGGVLFVSIQYLIFHPYVQDSIPKIRLNQGEGKFGKGTDHGVPTHHDTWFAPLAEWWSMVWN